MNLEQLQEAVGDLLCWELSEQRWERSDEIEGKEASHLTHGSTILKIKLGKIIHLKKY